MRRIFAVLGCVVLLLGLIVSPQVMATAAQRAEAAARRAEAAIAPSQDFLSISFIEFQIKTVAPKTSRSFCRARGRFQAIVTPPPGGNVRPGTRYLLDTNLILSFGVNSALGALTDITFIIGRVAPLDEGGVLFISGSFEVRGPFSTKLVSPERVDRGVVLTINPTFVATPIQRFSGFDPDGTELIVQIHEKHFGCFSN